MLVGVSSSSSVFARKKIMIMEPPLVRSCPRMKSWGELTTCLTKHGWSSKIERTVGKTRLLRLEIKNGVARTDSMLALYFEDPKGVHLGGMYELPEEPSTRSFILAVEELTVKSHTGVRIDLGDERRTQVSVDAVSGREAVQLLRHSLYCGGISWECVDVVSSCDILVDGKTYWTFRGTVTIKDNMILIAGNRSLAGTCAPSASQFLGWPERP